MNVVVVTDAAGSRKFDKAKSRLRIDGAQALAQAAGMRARLIGASKPVYQMIFV
jgi:phage terminase large subunit-like protein